MSTVAAYLEDERDLVVRLRRLPDASARRALLDASIARGEAAVRAADDPDALGDAMMSLAASHLLAAEEADDAEVAERHARAAAAWAARSVRLAGDVPGAVLHYVPRAGTVVGAAARFVPQETRRDWEARLASWSRLLARVLPRQVSLEREGRADLAVGMAAAEAAADVSTDDADRLRRVAIDVLTAAERELAAAGAGELLDLVAATRARCEGRR